MLMDSPAPDNFMLSGKVLDKTKHRYIDGNEQQPRNTLDQMRYLYSLVQELNISAAVGVHGGFLDFLNVLGVPASKTIRMVWEEQQLDLKRVEQLEGWKMRTHNIELLFHDGAKASWVNYGTPTQEQLEALFE